MKKEDIDSMIMRNTALVREVRPTVEDHAFNGNRIDKESAQKISKSLAEAVSGYSAITCVLDQDDNRRKAIVSNNIAFANYLSALTLMDYDPDRANELLESAKERLEAAKKSDSTLDAVAKNLERVDEALYGK